MVDSIRQPNILGEFVGGQQAGLDIQQQRLGLQQSRRQAPIRNALSDIGLERARREESSASRTGGITEDSERLQFLNRFGKAMQNIPLERRQEAATRLEPLAFKVGVQPGVVTDPENLTDDKIKDLIQMTEGFIRDPQSLERQKLNLRERELEQRKELTFASPGLAGLKEKEKIEAQRGRKADVASEVTTAQSQAKLSVKTIGKGFDLIAKINKNILNLDRALDVLRRGAGVGAVQRFLPSVKAASVELDQIRNELGLDVIGAVTFGALSQGELSLALDTALPTGLDTPQLTDFLQRKKAAQQKLLGYYQEQISFLSRPGATVAQFLESKQPQAAPQQAPQAPPEGVQFIGFE